MKNAPLVSAGSGPTDRKELRKAAPLAEGPRTLSGNEVQRVLSLFCGRRRAALQYDRFMHIKEELSEKYGAILDMVEPAHGGVKVVAHYEFRTTDRTINPDLNDMVVGMGFKLSHRSAPVTGVPFEDRYERRTRVEHDGSVVAFYEPRQERTYVISEGPASSDAARAPSAAENLLKLLSALRPEMLEDMPAMPAEIVDLAAARASRASLPPLAGQDLVDRAVSAMRI